MLGLADLLAETELTLEQQSYLGALRSSGAALARLVDDLLDASRIAAGRFALEPAATELEPLVEEIAELLAPRAHAKGIGLATRSAPDLPAVLVDGGRLRQILINLVGNAIGFTEKGAVSLSVRPVEPVRDGEVAIELEVADSGPGVAATDRARIFRDFERASPARGGAGLGLSISQRIVERMGSRIDVEPRPGGGSIFRFVLTLPVAGRAGPRAIPASLAGAGVLVVAPPSLEAEAIARELDDAGATTRIAGTLVEAAGLLGAASAARQPYQAVLIDARLPLDRRAALARLREAAGDAIPVVVLAEPSERAASGLFREEGFSAYLIRPIRRGSLLRIVANGLARRDDFQIDPADGAKPPRPERARRALSVLLVEDDPVQALLTRTVIERLGHEVVEARTAPSAREAAATQAFDIVFLDLHLDGDGDGPPLIRALADAAPEGHRPALVAMSGLVETAVAEAALAGGADLFLGKPVSPDQLRRAIDDMVSRRSAAAERHQTV
jgi:CheY-like chemotaxis protein